MFEATHLIGGDWRTGTGTRRLTVLSPFDGTAVTTVRIATDTDIVESVRAARDAAPGWARTAPAIRAAALRAAADAVHDAADDLAAIMSAEMGKPIGDARDSVDAG